MALVFDGCVRLLLAQFGYSAASLLDQHCSQAWREGLNDSSSSKFLSLALLALKFYFIFLQLPFQHKVLGTFIMEWDEGVILANKLLSTKDSAFMYAERLTELAVALGFDGWLVCCILYSIFCLE